MRELTKPYPTYEECEYLWDYYKTPPHVIRHCQAVSRTATLIAQKLNAKGYRLNVELLAVAGWLHDMMRLTEDHGGAAAKELRAMGYDDVAQVVKVHMTYHLDPDLEEISNTDILCFADRLVLEDHYAGLDIRMDYIIEKSRQYNDPEAEPRIRRSFQRTKVFQKNVEAIIGQPLESLEHMLD